MRFEPDENAPDDGRDAEAPRSDERAGDQPGEPSASDAESAPPEETPPATDIAPIPDAPGTQVDRLTDVLLAADQAAAEILDAARAEASEFVAETQRSTVERAESLRRETDNLMAQTSELTAKVIELTRATEQVMEGFRAELSLDAPEVREEALTPALPEPMPIDPRPEPETAAIEEIAPEDTALAPEPVAEEPESADDDSIESAPVLDEPSVTDDEPVEDLPASEDPEPDAASSATAEPAEPEAPAVPGPPPSASPRPAEAAPALEEPKRRGGLFGRLRGRGKEQPQPPAAPAQAPARTEESPALDTRSGPVTEGARLIARQMLATGLGEEEVKRQLREQFRLADPQAVLDSLRRNDRDDQSG